jgi:hypothetical protein
LCIGLRTHFTGARGCNLLQQLLQPRRFISRTWRHAAWRPRPCALDPWCQCRFTCSCICGQTDICAQPTPPHPPTFQRIPGGPLPSGDARPDARARPRGSRGACVSQPVPAAPDDAVGAPPRRQSASVALRGVIAARRVCVCARVPVWVRVRIVINCIIIINYRLVYLSICPSLSCVRNVSCDVLVCERARRRAACMCPSSRRSTRASGSRPASRTSSFSASSSAPARDRTVTCGTARVRAGVCVRGEGE